MPEPDAGSPKRGPTTKSLETRMDDMQTKLESVATQIGTIPQTLLSELAKQATEIQSAVRSDIHKMSEEFEGFKEFRGRFERYEGHARTVFGEITPESLKESAKKWFRLLKIGFGALVVGAFVAGGSLALIHYQLSTLIEDGKLSAKDLIQLKIDTAYHEKLLEDLSKNSSGIKAPTPAPDPPKIRTVVLTPIMYKGTIRLEGKQNADSPLELVYRADEGSPLDAFRDGVSGLARFRDPPAEEFFSNTKAVAIARVGGHPEKSVIVSITFRDQSARDVFVELLALRKQLDFQVTLFQ